MLLVLKCALTAFRQLLRPRDDLGLENLALRHQLEVLTRRAGRSVLGGLTHEQMLDAA